MEEKIKHTEGLKLSAVDCTLIVILYITQYLETHTKEGEKFPVHQTLKSIMNTLVDIRDKTWKELQANNDTRYKIRDTFIDPSTTRYSNS